MRYNRMQVVRADAGAGIIPVEAIKGQAQGAELHPRGPQ